MQALSIADAYANDDITEGSSSHPPTFRNKSIVELDDDFLTIPSSVALRGCRYPDTETQEWKLLRSMERKVMAEYGTTLEFGMKDIFTVSLHRHPIGGLGLTIHQREGRIYVDSLKDSFSIGCNIGIQPGDHILGVNGIAFVGKEVGRSLSSFVSMLKTFPGSLALHLRRPDDDSTHNTDQYEEGDKAVYHPLAKLLCERGLLSSKEDVALVTEHIQDFTERTREWEATARLSFNPINSGLLEGARRATSALSPSTPLKRSRKSSNFLGEASKPARSLQHDFVEMVAVSKALSVRIVNQFTEEERKQTAYTIWVYDCERRTEWYAPVRYLEDFEELRLATVDLNDDVSTFPFPTTSFFVSRRAESQTRQLESFLRSLCSAIYKLAHPSLPEIAIHLQSFLGCDSGGIRKVEASHGDPVELLASAVQLYIYRIFLLKEMEKVNDDFVKKTRREIAKAEEVRHLELSKKRSCEIASSISGFLANLTDLLLDGCREDLYGITARDEYNDVRNFSTNIDLEIIFCDAIREQAEIEVYLPLRSVLSRLVVNAWRHDDREMIHKMAALMLRPQSNFNIRNESPSQWRSPISILGEVGRSSLPCRKVLAIVNAAKEIIRVHAAEHHNSKETFLGADEFLPILVFCVSRADLERPMALQALLTSLATSTGESAYYLASFVAAIEHIRDLDLASESGY